MPLVFKLKIINKTYNRNMPINLQSSIHSIHPLNINIPSHSNTFTLLKVIQKNNN